MGLLDPKMDKERTFELLRKKGAVQAVLEFYGGHDEGDVQGILLTMADGSKQDLDAWYCGGYTLDPERKAGDEFRWVPCSTPANEDEELSDLLQGPINEKFGSWGGVDSTSGKLTWDVEAGTAKMEYTQDEPIGYEEVF